MVLNSGYDLKIICLSMCTANGYTQLIVRAGMALFAEMIFSPVLHRVSQPWPELNEEPTVLVENCCFENGEKVSGVMGS